MQKQGSTMHMDQLTCISSTHTAHASVLPTLHMHQLTCISSICMYITYMVCVMHWKHLHSYATLHAQICLYLLMRKYAYIYCTYTACETESDGELDNRIKRWIRQENQTSTGVVLILDGSELVTHWALVRACAVRLCTRQRERASAREPERERGRGIEGLGK